LRANGLVEIEHIADVTSRLIVNRTALKTRPDEIGYWIDTLREVTEAAKKNAPVPA
jgi:ATP phosphoribosyltransferase